MNQLLEDIKKNEYSRFYLLYGDSDYTINNLKNRLRKALNFDEVDMNYTTFYGKDLDLHSCADAINTAPFFNDKRLVIMENTELFKTSNDLSDYLKDSPESTIVLFLEKRKDDDTKKAIVNKNNKLYKFVSKNGVVIECKKPNKDEMISFTLIRLKESGKAMKKSTLNYFLSQVHPNFYNIKNELDKLVAYVGEREEIKIEDIDELTCKLINNQMFKMIDEIALGRTDRVFYMYRELLELQINVNVILANLRTHFKQLLEVKLSDRAPRSEVISKTRMQPFLYGSYVGQAERFSYPMLRVMLEKVCDYEYKFKTGQISDVLGLEILIIELLDIKKGN